MCIDHAWIGSSNNMMQLRHEKLSQRWCRFQRWRTCSTFRDVQVPHTQSLQHLILQLLRSWNRRNRTHSRRMAESLTLTLKAVWITSWGSTLLPVATIPRTSSLGFTYAQSISMQHLGNVKACQQPRKGVIQDIKSPNVPNLFFDDKCEMSHTHVRHSLW